jgi:chemotaxis protein MotB
MRTQKRPADEPKAPVPGWIVSFTDMVTLLLAFFVLLLTLAKDRDPELFFVGQGSFRRAIAGLGIPSLFPGKLPKIRQQYRRVVYCVEADPYNIIAERIIDDEQEQIAKLFHELRSQIETSTSDTSEKVISASATPISFADSQARLDKSAQAYLKSFAANLTETIGARAVRVEVIALAASEPTRARQWRLSAQRAAEVERYLRKALAAEITKHGWQVGSRGAGAGSQSTRRLGLIPGKSSVAIKIVEASTKHGR